MKKLNLLFFLLLASFVIPQQSHAVVYVPESPRNQDAVFNVSDLTVTLSATAPTKTEYDWDTYEQYDLPYISYIKIERHELGASWPAEEYARIENPKMGEKFEFVDKNIELDKKYEYKFACYVDANAGSSVYATVYTGVTPGMVTDFTLTVADHTANAVDMSMTAPLKSDTGTDLTGEMAIEIQQYEGWSFTTIHTVENVKPGQVCTWTHENLTMNKRYEYRAIARNGVNGLGQGESVMTYVGLDYPGTPANLEAVSKGTSVELTWDAPVSGGRNGNYNPKATTYTVKRIYFDGKQEVAVSNLVDTKYTDNPGFDEERALTYKVFASNASGNSMKDAESEEVVVGNPAALPFAESFKGGLLTHMGWTRQTTQNDPYYNYEAWDFVTTGTTYYFPTDEYLEIAAQDADEGMATCKFYGDSKDGQTETLISPHVDVTNFDKVEVAFYYLDFNANASKNVIRAFISKDDAEWEQAFVSVPPVTEEKPVWKEVKLPVTLDKAVKNVRVKIEAIRHDGPITNAYIDNVTVAEVKESGVEALQVDDVDAKVEYFNLQGMYVETPETPGIYIKRCGKKVEKVIVR